MFRIFLLLLLPGVTWSCGGKYRRTHTETELSLTETKSYLRNIPKLWEPFINFLTSKYILVKHIRYRMTVITDSHRQMVFIEDNGLNINNIEQFSSFFFMKKKYFSKWWNFLVANFQGKGIFFINTTPVSLQKGYFLCSMFCRILYV